MPALETLDDAQRSAAQALIDGPRQGIFGPFIPLIRSPALMDRLARVGEFLRFEAALPSIVNELVTVLVARHTGNQFEWHMHVPRAQAAGVDPRTIAAIAAGARPRTMSDEEELAHDFTCELLAWHGVADATYAHACACWGEAGVVELTALIGYFATVCWVMNVARTPAERSESAPDLHGLPG